MPTYRKKKGKDTWHWCTNCNNYPKTDYEEKHLDKRPTNGELCDECLGKEKKGECKT